MTTPNPGPKRASPPERYRAMSLHKLAQAQEELDKDDLCQASEKIWGAVAEIVKAVAQQRGWNHHAHNYLSHAANYVGFALGRRDLVTIFAAASEIHTNFYEHQVFKDEVEVRLESARTFVEAMDVVLSDPQRELLPNTPEQETRLRSLTRKTAFSHGPELTPEEVTDLPPVVP